MLTHDGTSRSASIRQAVLEAARRRERAAEMRRAVLRMDLGEPERRQRRRGTGSRPRQRALMIYLDSAAVVKLAHAEPESAVLRSWLDEPRPGGSARDRPRSNPSGRSPGTRRRQPPCYARYAARGYPETSVNWSLARFARPARSPSSHEPVTGQVTTARGSGSRRQTSQTNPVI